MAFNYKANMNKVLEKIVITEKPDYISWDEIKACIWNSHSENRTKGVIMGNPSLPADTIRNRIENNGKMLVALIDDKVVGTAAFERKSISLWCGKKDEEYAHVCFDAVLPQYCGLGIFKQLELIREQLVLDMGLTKIIGDTHEYNYKRLNIAKKNNYKFIDYKFYKDHFNIVWVKWLDGCPYSDFICFLMFIYYKIGRRIKYKWFKTA